MEFAEVEFEYHRISHTLIPIACERGGGEVGRGGGGGGGGGRKEQTI